MSPPQGSTPHSIRSPFPVPLQDTSFPVVSTAYTRICTCVAALLSVFLFLVCFPFIRHDYLALKSVPRLSSGIQKPLKPAPPLPCKHSLLFPQLTFEHGFNLGHHWLHACLSIRWMVAVSSIFLIHSPLFGSTKALFQQSINVVVKIILQNILFRHNSPGTYIPAPQASLTTLVRTDTEMRHSRWDLDVPLCTKKQKTKKTLNPKGLVRHTHHQGAHLSSTFQLRLEKG